MIGGKGEHPAGALRLALCGEHFREAGDAGELKGGPADRDGELQRQREIGARGGEIAATQRQVRGLQLEPRRKGAVTRRLREYFGDEFAEAQRALSSQSVAEMPQAF